MLRHPDQKKYQGYNFMQENPYKQGKARLSGRLQSAI
jgi:hypothetical protein